METGWRHNSHEVQREFERIRRQSASALKAVEPEGAATAPGSSQVPLPPIEEGLISGAINAEAASPRIYVGVRVVSDGTIDVAKRTNASDRLYVFDLRRPLTLQHNTVSVLSSPALTRYDTIRTIDFTDSATPHGITFDVENEGEHRGNVTAECNYRLVTRSQAEPCIETYNTIETDTLYLDFATNCLQPCVEGHESDAVLYNTRFVVTNAVDGHARIEAQVSNPFYVKNIADDDSLITLSQTGLRYLKFKNTDTVSWEIDDDASGDCFRGVVIQAHSSEGAGGGTTYTGSNLGTGGAGKAEVFSSIVSNDFRFRRLVAGTNITISQDANYITINSSITDTNDTYVFTNVGTGEGLVYKSVSTAGSVNTVSLRTIKAGNNIFITNNTNDITVDGYEVSGEKWGNCTAIATPYNFYESTVVNDTLHTVSLRFRNFGRANDLFVNECVNGGYVLDVNVQGNNLGSGAGVYYSKTYSGTVAQLNLRSIVAGAGIDVDISFDDTEIIISSTVVDTNDTYTFVNVGTGTGQVYRNVTSVGSAHTVNLKTIKQGTGITVTNNADDITIACTIVDTNDTYNFVNVGTGEGLVYRDKTTVGSVNTVNIKSIKSGTGITVTNNANEIVIACTVTDTLLYYDADSVGGQTVVYRDKSGTGTIGDPIVFHFKTLQAGTNVNFTGSTTDKIVINAVQPTIVLYSMANVGTGEGHVWRDTTGSNPYTFNLKTIKAGAGITVTDNPNDITISCSIIDTIMYYDADSVGGQVVVYRDKSGTGSVGDPVVFHFKTLQAGSNIDFSGSTADKIVINSSYVNNTYQMANVGTGEGHVWRDTTGTFPQTFNLKTLKAGQYVFIEDNADDITINTWDIDADVWGTCAVGGTLYNWYKDTVDNSTTHTRTMRFRNFAVTDDLFLVDCPSGGAYVLRSDVDVENLGSGYALYDGKYHDDPKTWLKLRTLLPGSGIDLDYDLPGDSVVISCSVVDTNDTYSFDNVGTGTGLVYKSVDTLGSAHTVHMKSIKAGTGITVTNNADDITITCTVTDTNTTYNFNNVGTGDGQVVKNTTGAGPVDVNIKSIKAGTGITVTNGTDDITITCTLTQRYYSMWSDGGEHSIVNGTTGTGTVGDPIVFHMKSVKAGANIVISDETNTITIVSDIFWVHSNLGTGEGVYYNTTNTGTVSDPYNVKFKSIKGGTNITVTSTTSEITITCDATDHTYSFLNVGDGEYVYKSATLSGLNTVVRMKTIKAGSGISVVSDVDDKVIVISSNMQVKATGLTQSNVGIIEFVDNLYDTTWVPDFATAGTAKLTPQFQNYNTKHDFAHFIDSGTKVTGKTVADNTWEHLWFDNEVIADTPGYVNKGETNTIPWLFKPSDDVNFNWRVVLHLGIVGCMPTDNGRAAVIKFPEIALFKGETYWDTIDVDELVGAYGELRAYLMISDPFLGGAVPEAGSKSYLQGSDTVYLEDNSAELNVRFRHQTGQDVYVKLVKGSISITKVGMRCALGADAQEVSYDFSSF